MKTSKRNIIALALTLIICSSGVYADCFTGSLIDSCTGSAWFGLRSDGELLNQGQSFTLDCTSELQSASFQLTVTEGGNINGVPYLQAGDLVMFGVFADGSNIATATRIVEMPHSDGTEWITADFTNNQIILEPGDYHIAMAPFYENKCALVVFDNTDHGTGHKVKQYGMSGEWIPSLDSDLNHEFVLSQEYVGNNDTSWGEVKSMFR